MAKAKLNPVTGKMQPTGDYPVGFARTPVDSRYKPGQSGYPSGRPKGSRNRKNEFKEIISKTVTIRDGDKERKISLPAANLLAHGLKGAKGDARSSSLFLNKIREMGLLDLENSGSNDFSGQGGSPTTSRPSEVLTQNLDLALLTREDMSDLSRAAEKIDLGGDFTALSAADFERVKEIVNKGRGKDVTPPR
jgi:Family of unknown function (DUF5681)